MLFRSTGPNDPSRDHPQDLSLQDLLDILPSYTKIVPESLDEGLLPFSASNAAPSVYRLFLIALCLLHFFYAY